MNADSNFDVVVLGTGLTESITAAALSKAGFKVVHLDTNPYYGGDEASLTADELVQWADKRAESTVAPSSSYLTAQRAVFTSITHSPTIPDHSRHYSISLSPSLITSVGPLITSLVSSGVSRYGGYRLLDRVGLYDRKAGIKAVPGSKEDVFKSKEMSLIEKRRLMRFLMFASADFEGKKEIVGHEDTPFVEYLTTVFSLGAEVSDAIAYALAFCVSSTDPALPALNRLRGYLRSSGKYGASPFLVGHYGGSGEIAQGFCRVSAVNGGVYILDKPIRSITPPPVPAPSADETSSTPSSTLHNKYTIELENFPEPFTADIVISSSSQLPAELRDAAYILPSAAPLPVLPVARCVAILDSAIPFPSLPRSTAAPPTDEDAEGAEAADVDATPPEEEERPVDTAIVVFPPSSLPGGSTTAAVHAFVTGQGTMSAPKGKYIVYLSLPVTQSADVSPETLLRPYLDAIVALTPSPSPDDSAPAKPLFSLYYIQHPPPADTAASGAENSSTVLVAPAVTTVLSDAADAASVAAEALFFKAVDILTAKNPDVWRVEEIEAEASSGGDVLQVIKFWPPLYGDPEEEEGENW